MIYTAEVCWSMANNKLNYFNCTLPRRQDSEVWVHTLCKCVCARVLNESPVTLKERLVCTIKYTSHHLQWPMYKCKSSCDRCHWQLPLSTFSSIPSPSWKVDFNISFTFATATANQLIHYNCLLEKLLTKASSLSFSSSSRTVALQKRSKTANQVIFLAFRVNYFRWEAKAFIYYTAREGTLLFAIGSLSASCHK